jgi:hypothetical protein
MVTHGDAGIAENVSLDFRFWSHGPLPPALSPNTITASVSYSPTSAAIPLFSGTAEPDAPVVVRFYDCDTNLLYPFVTNYLAGGSFAYNNLGSTILVANTTADPLASAAAIAMNPQEQEGTAVPQSGTCTFWLFPNAGSAFADGSAGTMVSFTSPTIVPGGTYGFDMGSIPAFMGKTGYIYAKCGFQNAHGLGFFQDNYGLGEPGYAAVYPAIVIPTPEFYHRTPAGDGLGESAVAPIAVNSIVQKLLFNGVHNGAK